MTLLLVTDAPTLTHVFARAGVYTVRVTAVDALGWQSSAEARLAQLIAPAENTLAYAFVWRNKTNRFVSDDTRDYDLPKVRLRAGLNALLVKVDQGVGGWAFKLRVLNSSGSVMRDVTVRTKAVLP